MNSLHHEKYYKPIGINLSRQTNTSIPKKKVEKLKEDDDAKKIFIAVFFINVY